MFVFLRTHVNRGLNPTLRPLSQQLHPSWKNKCLSRALLRHTSSLGTSAVAEEEQVQDGPQLQPVPRLFNALFRPQRQQRIKAEKNINVETERYYNGAWSTGRSWLEVNTKTGLDVALQNPEDGRHLLAEAWEQTVPTKTSTGFNAIIARLRSLGLEPGSRHVLYGMTTAGYPSALKQYLVMLGNLIVDDPLPLQEYRDIFTYIAKGLLRDHKADPQNSELAQDLGLAKWHWIRFRRREQWFNVITGLKEDKVDQPEPREFSLYDLGPGLSYENWQIYMDLLHLLVGESAIYHEYLRSISPEQGWQSSRIPSHTSMNPDMKISTHLLNVTLRTIAKTDLTLAYEVVGRHTTSFQDIEYSTWKLLLADLDLFRATMPKIFPKIHEAKSLDERLVRLEEHVLDSTAPSRLIYQLRKIEGVLGIRWSGGEDGYHVLEQLEEFLKNPGRYSPLVQSTLS